MDEKLRYQVRLRAKNCCEYCCLPSEYSDAPFQLDHIIAETHGGSSTLQNIAWSCLYCNRYKGPNLSGWDQELQAVVRLFNPRTNQWSEHFQWDGPILRSITSIGKVTLQVLRINDEEAILVRRLLLDLGINLTPT